MKIRILGVLFFIISILVSVMYYRHKNSTVEYYIPEIEDPCEIRICRTMEFIEHELQIPKKIKEEK